MSHRPRTIQTCFVVVAALIGVVTVAAFVRALKAKSPPDADMGLGNRQLVFYHRGFDVRIALIEPEGAIGLLCDRESSAALAAQDKLLNAANAQWGWANHWLRLPSLDISIGWFGLLAVVLALPAFWRPRARRGFPVQAAPRAP
ncbi:MAG TPA: hypothetical protein VH518_23845 [Tepidisphaeraceae bacterium]|jgi:hypothetical protein